MFWINLDYSIISDACLGFSNDHLAGTLIHDDDYQYYG